LNSYDVNQNLKGGFNSMEVETCVLPTKGLMKKINAILDMASSISGISDILNRKGDIDFFNEKIESDLVNSIGYLSTFIYLYAEEVQASIIKDKDI
jgi:hypothetical protein